MNKKDLFYMSVAELTATQSKDPHTKVGSCIVKNGRILSVGWNGAPRKINDNIVPYHCNDKKLPQRFAKYIWIIHSEVNAILNFSGSLSDLDGASIYVTTFPCVECSKIIIQSGISKVYYLNEYSDTEDAKLLLDSGGVSYEKIFKEYTD